MSPLTWITEKELERELKNKRGEFCEKHNLNRSKRNNNFVGTKDIKLVTREFHFVVVQKNDD